MTVAVKICGISTQDGLQACVDAGVDWIGLVFFARSPRFVTAAQAERLVSRLPTSIKPVGLFVGASDAEIDAVLAVVPLAVLQLYDRPERVAELRARTGRPVWHAVPVQTASDLPRTTEADGLVIEGYLAGAGRPGGNGAKLDPGLLRTWSAPTPWLLAGGLRVDNVANAIGAARAKAVDVSSGVESSPGVKHAATILAFAQAARRGGDQKAGP